MSFGGCAGVVQEQVGGSGCLDGGSEVERAGILEACLLLYFALRGLVGQVLGRWGLCSGCKGVFQHLCVVRGCLDGALDGCGFFGVRGDSRLLGLHAWVVRVVFTSGGVVVLGRSGGMVVFRGLVKVGGFRVLKMLLRVCECKVEAVFLVIGRGLCGAERGGAGAAGQERVNCHQVHIHRALPVLPT